MDYGAIIQAAVALFSSLQEQGRQERAQHLLQQSLDEFGNISLPKLQEIVAEEMGPSAMESIDPSLDAAQHEALGAYDDIIEGGGMSTADKADINNIGNTLGRRLRNTRQGIRDSMAVRGLEGSGADYATQGEAAQDAEQRLSVAGENTAGEALKRRFSAIGGKGALAGQMWDRKARAAQAADEIARFNAGARAGAKAYNASIPQQQFQNELTKAAGKAGRIGAMVGQSNMAGQTQRLQMAGIGAAAGRAFSDYGDTNYTKKQKQKVDASGNPYDSEPDEWENPWA